ncbi:hypothetical protein TNCV_222461 [Trichonephila clavipes]|nr:hypothetical protein TNCV_222461 [Trichonephila clavipes]
MTLRPTAPYLEVKEPCVGNLVWWEGGMTSGVGNQWEEMSVGIRVTENPFYNKTFRLDWKLESWQAPPFYIWDETGLGIAVVVGRYAWQTKAGTNGKQSDRLGFGDLR